MKATILVLVAFYTMVFFFVLAPILGLAIPALLLTPKVWIIVAAGVLVLYILMNDRE